MKNFKLFFIIILVSFICVLFETTILNFPFVFLLALICLVFRKEISTYIFVFLLGFVVDAVRVSNFGITPLFIFGVISCILLYEKYFGSSDLVVATVIASGFLVAYVYFLSYSLTLLVLFLVTIVIGVASVNIIRKRGILFG